MKRTFLTALAAAIAWLGGPAGAQQALAGDPSLAPDIGPGTQGDLAYSGPADVGGYYYWLCSFVPPTPIGELIEDAHLTKPGNLASFDIWYATAGSSGEPYYAEDLSAVVKFYANDSSDSIVPDASSEIASFTLTGLPRYRNGTRVKRTFDIAQPGPYLPEDVWMGVELVFPPGAQAYGSLVFCSSDGCGGTGAGWTPQWGASHSLNFFGASSCDPFSLWDWDLGELPNFPPTDFDGNGTNDVVSGPYFPPISDGSTTLNYRLAIRVFDVVANQPPTCVADLSQAEAAFLEDPAGTFVVTEGETLVVPFTGTDPDGDLLTATLSGLPATASLSPTSGTAPLDTTLTWTPSASDDGVYSATVTFSDGSLTSSCSLGVDVNLKPICSASDQTVPCTSPAGATVQLNGSATDPDDDDATLGYHWAVSNDGILLSDPDTAMPTGIFPIGVTMATLTVTDGRGGVAICDVLVTVEDTEPPEVMCTSDVAALWPPNHKMQEVTLIVTATDACAAPGSVLPITVYVRSNEPDDAPGLGDGSTTGDVNGSDGYSVSPGGIDVTPFMVYDSANQQWMGTLQLRAERDGTGKGRKYTIDVQALDPSGNSNDTSCCIVVPHDRRKLANP